MSKKFTGITSAGSAIPVYDKDAHSALSAKLDTSAFSSVSGEFATVDDVVAAVSGKADTSAIPSLDGYATQEWVGEQGYLTEVPESAVSGFATHEEVESATSGKADTSALSAKLDASAVETWPTWDDETTVTGINGYPISAKFGGSGFLPMSLSGMSASGTYFKTTANQFFGINQSGISADPNGGVRSVQIGGYNAPEISISGSQGSMSFNSAGGEYRKADNSVVWKIGQADHLYVTDSNPDYQNVAIDISQAPRDISSTRVMIGKNGLSACNIGTSSGINTTNAPATIVGNSQVKVDYGDMHSVLTVGDMYVQHNGYVASSTWSLTGSVQKREIECDSATSAITAIAGSAVGGGSTYSAGDNIDITDDVISGKDWSEDIASATSGLMQTSGLEYDGDKISGYMGSAFKAGDELPSGVMVESAVGYNAVNEISGYNGSAIAQYGAEKQWLVHDDTLVHASNSAQYALGVNVSAVQTLMGMMGPKLNEETFAGYWNGYPEYQYLQEFHFNSNVGSNSALPDQIKRASAVENRRHIDLSNSYIVYGNSWITLPLQWNLGNTRAGGFMIYDDGIYYRGYDSSPSDCTAFICYRYRKQ